ncbi:MAG: hypothetical protein BYD32DRAFT_184030 [Podila humilis]|nr:MAG: hypothetical protein BYD32DRAFT_184030 [Podila humilis]
MDYRAGPWPSSSSYLYLLKSFFVDYIHDLIGLVYGGGRSPSALPLVSTVLPSYALNLLFEIIQTWIFRWIYPRLVPSSFFSKKKSRKSSSTPPLLSPMPLRNTNSSGASNSDQRRYSGARSRRSSSRVRQPSTRHHPTDETPPSTTATPTPDASTTAITAGEISATIMAAMPTVSSNTPTTTTQAINRARRGLRYLSTVAPRNPTLLQEFYPEMVCAMTSSMMTRVLLYPLDTVASRVSAQGGSFPGIGASPTVYAGLWDCCVRSVRTEGVLGLYSGVIDCIIVEAMVRWVVLEGTWFAHLLIKWLHRR